jgi:hypothetical protein
MASNIILPEDFNIKNVSFSDVRKLDKGLSVYVSYKGAPLIIQTPPMTAPFGVSAWDNDPNHSINLSFNGKLNSPSLAALEDSLKALDELVIDTALKNQETWFKSNSKPYVRPTLEALYTSNIRQPNPAYEGTIKVKLPLVDGKYTCDVYDENKNLADLANMNAKGAKVTAILQCVSVWFVGAKFGLTWRALQMKVVPTMKTIRGQGYAFRETTEDTNNVDDSDDHDNNDNVANNDTVPETTNADGAENDAGDSSDDNDDDAEDDDEIDKPSAAPVKKVVYRRKK